MSHTYPRIRGAIPEAARANRVSAPPNGCPTGDPNMTASFLLSVTNHVATFSLNGTPWNLILLDCIDQLERQLPGVLGNDEVRAIIFTAEVLDNFSAGSLEPDPRGGSASGESLSILQAAPSRAGHDRERPSDPGRRRATAA
ncbi:MAG: hypothetical protein ACKO6H_07520 [Betaproteobacteria bacterium]